MKLVLLSLTLAIGSFSALCLLPTQQPHLSVAGKTLCGSAVGNHVDVADAYHEGYCRKCEAAFRHLDSNDYLDRE